MTVGRLGIDDVRPSTSDRTLPTKAVVGEVVPLSALVWREGHDAIAATAMLTSPSGRTIAVAMNAEEDRPDYVHAVFAPDEEGLWRFRIDAWSDPYSTWRNAVTKKSAAGQSAEEMANDLAFGAELFDRAARAALANARAARRTDEGEEDARAAQRADEGDVAELLAGVAEALRSDAPLRERLEPALSDEVTALMSQRPVRDLLTRGPECQILVERKKAAFSSWYELFPRSTGGWDDNGHPVHGTFQTTADALERVAAMGFDTVYFPPIHPIGEVNRKGPNNSLVAEEGDVGSPWAIGSKAGGHDAIHPELGTEEDFVALIERAKQLGLEVALDFALQAAPDHPWARDHRGFFTELADGTIAYAENPPKKYQDIYPINFDNDRDGIYNECYRVIMHWVNLGVTTFRVDNPHTKPTDFWHWLISKVHETHPEVIFLAEAFTRPPRLFGLAKAGFTQSYTYFPWKTTKRELTGFTQSTVRFYDISRPSFWVNTPDILQAYIQTGNKAAFAVRATLAATLSPLWGMYSGFELYEHEPVTQGSEEYLDSEKYQLRPRDFAGAKERGESLEDYITLLNRLRQNHPALQQMRTLHFHTIDNDQLIAYSKVDPATGDAVLVVVNLDPTYPQEGFITLDMEELGVAPSSSISVRDEISGETYQWGMRNYVRLAPQENVAHIFALPEVGLKERVKLAYRRMDDDEYRP
ncbi:maltotransferase domain-containing protein [Corynebacterium aquatimens]|uniref:Alpha-1,4-glucan:maltose-1-phosphate maltosyltransferase n=1 Tax=Corynebacterium aquatimens TaxID=1190508 RepID=A0A931DWH7_9CORY|nr:maltotransferase domain-containing protein [Corynebacterium aquatimens]MBG6121385.1 starch synthase (maltosyl-transferring) [Corynebacterium aquatimens]WJY66070.1 Alpha-1,4-glucan:maltose-1-phosphate maltosyltransferase [Corynebacterium aquatimens]